MFHITSFRHIWHWFLSLVYFIRLTENCRHSVRKAKGHSELRLQRKPKNNKYVQSNRKLKIPISQMVNKDGKINGEKEEVLNSSIVSSSATRNMFHLAPMKSRIEV